MNGKLTITVGIPGSGKTHEASLILHNEGRENVELVSRDDLRHLLFRSEGILTNAQELRITQIQKELVKDALRMGKHVVVHDMNLRERYRKGWAKLAADMGAEFAMIDLTQVPLETCVARNKKRGVMGGREVPERAIRDLHRRFVKNRGTVKAPQIAPKGLMDLMQYVPDLSKPEAIIVDLDGTVADCEGVRSPYDYTKVQLDKPKLQVIQHVQDEAYKLDTKILFVSGRLARLGKDDQCYKDTEEWLYEHVKVPIELLAMRDRDGVDDTVIKYEIFNKYIRDFYNVKYCLDDRNRVVKMWRSLGLLCLQVAEGDF
jgi:predicted kinase